MATILINNPSKEQIMEHIDSKSHYVETTGIILAMSDMKRWFNRFEELSDFLLIDKGYTLCQAKVGEEIYSEEDTLIINENEN